MKKTELINELSNIIKEMERVWEFHPKNPKQVNIVDYHRNLTMYSQELDKRINEIK